MKTEAPTDTRLLLLWPDDTVFVATAAISAGTHLLIEGSEVVLESRLALGHKIARHGMADGETIVKFGAPIGRATQAIARGEHVHVHNVASNYTPTYTIE